MKIREIEVDPNDTSIRNSFATKLNDDFYCLKCLSCEVEKMEEVIIPCKCCFKSEAYQCPKGHVSFFHFPKNLLNRKPQKRLIGNDKLKGALIIQSSEVSKEIDTYSYLLRGYKDKGIFYNLEWQDAKWIIGTDIKTAEEYLALLNKLLETL